MVLTEALLTRIERDLHVGPQFVASFEPLFLQENPMFLLAVIRYKYNPTWDSCLSLYNLYINEKSKWQINIASPSRQEIMNYIKGRSDSQKAFSGAGVNLHFGAANVNVFNKAFSDVLTSFSGMVLSGKPKLVYDAFLAKYKLTE